MLTRAARGRLLGVTAKGSWAQVPHPLSFYNRETTKLPEAVMEPFLFYFWVLTAHNSV